MAPQTRNRLLAFRDGAKLVSGTRLTDDSLLAGSTENTPLTGVANEFFLGERQQQFDFAVDCLLIGFASKIN